ncbi:MAG: hypothetical protein R3F28_13575 [Candidatus Kapaibacterium sp.]|nr:hypothetical protein [Ignavibacteria bacterium]
MVVSMAGHENSTPTIRSATGTASPTSPMGGVHPIRRTTTTTVVDQAYRVSVRTSY